MTTDRGAWLRRIRGLDPERDHQEIHRITAGYEFPWDYARALELALFRTYCVPSVSALLDATGEFRERPQRRYDDTALLMGEISEHGYDSERGREALRTINRVHARFAIADGDMRYILSTFVIDPIDWIERFGWRPLTDVEREAAFRFYREVGVRMGIRDLPADLPALRRFKTEFEREHFSYRETNRRIGTYTLDLLAGWYPPPLRPLVRAGVRSLLSDDVLAAFGFAAAPRLLGRAVAGGLHTRAFAVRRLPARVLPPRRASALLTIGGHRSYPGYPAGHRPSDLGAPPPTDLDPRWLRRPGDPPRE